MKRLLVAMASVTAVLFAGCNHLEDTRTPPAAVWISFATQADWTYYGVSGALDHKRFIRSERIPSDFPWTELTQTGYGGVLLVGGLDGTPMAYDLSCPVENSAQVRVQVDEEELDAFCPKCGSRYYIFNNYGHPRSGPALDDGYGLTKYTVGPGSRGEYMVIR